MIMKKYIFAIIAFALMAWGCSSDDDDSTIPVGTDVRPEWQAPNYDILEQLMCVEVTLQDKLAPYASEADMMCATIDGEVRAVSTPYKVDDRWHFFMIVGSDNLNVNVSLSYYCDRLHRIFTVSPWTSFDSSLSPSGDTGIYTPIFVK